MATKGYWDNKGAPATKATWANPEVVAEEKRSTGGWYYNPASGNVDRWWAGNQQSSSSPAPQSSSQSLAVPSSADQLPSYFQQFQDKAFNLLDKIPTKDSLAEALTPETPKPETINRSQMLEDQRALYKVEDLEKELNTLKDEERLIQANLRETKGIEEGKPVALGVMAGRIGEEERVAQTRLDYLSIRKSAVVDELNTKYNVINTYINYAGLDYQDASKAYNDDFERNVQVQNLLSGFRQEAFGYAVDTIKLGETLKQNNIDNARANLTTISNAITAGNMNFNDLGADERLQIQKLEIQSGLPVGITAQMKEKVDPKANLMFTTSNEGITQMGFLQPDGTIKTVEAGRRISSSSSTTSDTKVIRQNFDDASIEKNFPDLVEEFATTMSLEEIYKAYANTDKGRKYGTPIEDKRIMTYVWKIAHGDMTEEEARKEMEGTTGYDN